MKLVTSRPGEKTRSINVEEHQFERRREELLNLGVEVTPRDWELFRVNLHDGGRAIIYKDNRVVRQRCSWYECRALAAIGKELSADFESNVNVQAPNGDIAEFDGRNEEIAVEVKYRLVTDNIVSFYEEKRKKYGFDVLYLVAPRWKIRRVLPQNISPVYFKPDVKSIRDYYELDMQPCYLVDDLLGSRHVRVLNSLGYWQGFQRQVTQSCKYNFVAYRKLQHELAVNFRYKTFPIKVYYSLAEMGGPIREFRGKGTPIEKRIIFALDVDGSHQGPHVVSHVNGVCLACVNSAKSKVWEIGKILGKSHTRVFFSGSKGYHVYFTDESDKVIIHDKKEMTEISRALSSHADNVSFVDKNGEFDVHRIFKIPHTVDASTGYTVSEYSTRIVKDVVGIGRVSRVRV